MARATPEVLEAPRLPELCRQVCLRSGMPVSPAAGPAERFVLRSGAEPPEFFAKLLEEAALDDEAEAAVGEPDRLRPGPGQVAVQTGFDSPCPVDEELRRAVRSGSGRVMVFAIERRDTAGRLLGLTWVGLPEDEPLPEAPFRAAVLRRTSTANGSRDLKT